MDALQGMQSSGDKILMRLLEATNLRARVIASNVANANTPGYKRQVVRFEELLRETMKRNPAAAPFVRPQIEVDAQARPGFDGNSVTLEAELTAFEENRIMYELYSSILATKAEMVRASIEER